MSFKLVSCFYRAMHFSAKRGIAIACRLSVRPSVCPSVTLVNCDHIGWNSSEIFSPSVSLGRSLFATSRWRVCSKGNIPTVVSKSKSWFDLNHDWITWFEELWFDLENVWFDLDLIWNFMIWFEIIPNYKKNRCCVVQSLRATEDHSLYWSNWQNVYQ